MKQWDGSNWTGTDWDAGNFRGPNGEDPPGALRASLTGSATVSGWIDFTLAQKPARPARAARSRIMSRPPRPARIRARVSGAGAMGANGSLDWTAWNDDDELALLLAA